MEAVLSSESVNTDVLPGNLSYGLDPTGSWCTHKRDATVYALGNLYSPSGVQMISIPFGSSSEWLVPESVVFSALFTNKEAKPCIPADPDPNRLFERMDIRMGGQLVESVTELARCNTLFTRLTMSAAKKLQIAQMGFGTAVPTASAVPYFDSAQNHKAETVASGDSVRIFWKLHLSALLSQHRWCPLFCLSGQGLVVNLFLAPFADSLTKSGTTNSMKFELSDVQAKCSMCTIDDQLQNGFNEQLLAGAALRIPLKKIESIYNYIPSSSSNNFDVALSRNYTRLASLWATFAQEPESDGTKMLCNTFYVPNDDATREKLSYFLQLGTRRIPDMDSVGVKEAWWRLMDCVGIGGSLAHSNGITKEDYFGGNTFAIAVDTEKISHLASSGENLSNTSTLFLKLKNVGANQAALPSRVHLIASYDAIIEARATTIEIFE